MSSISSQNVDWFNSSILVFVSPNALIRFEGALHLMECWSNLPHLKDLWGFWTIFKGGSSTGRLSELLPELPPPLVSSGLFGSGSSGFDWHWLDLLRLFQFFRLFRLFRLFGFFWFDWSIGSDSCRVPPSTGPFAILRLRLFRFFRLTLVLLG